MIVKIEQRLQDPPRFLMVPADEAAMFAVPLVMGMLGKAIITGLVVGAVLWSVWRRLKGEGGLPGIFGALYWYLPSRIGLFPGLPDSSVPVWEG